ncbi:MAG: large conductance mechanosensitive channel protein MscL [Clostridiales bacterium]|jgi:large conductance mechanosensitive channel|nr:large conductance mechanosensitive channel protein MscL [Clostridiales bacterium]
MASEHKNRVKADIEKGKKKTKAFFNDFKKFITKGNILDLAIAVIIGGAFGKIVTSLVGDIITPLIAAAFGKDSFGELRWVLKEAVYDPADKTVVLASEIAVRYGAFIQTILDFLIVAFFIFVAYRIITRASASIKAALIKPAPPAPPAPPKPTQEELLTQIRDLLAERNAAEKAAADSADAKP